MGLKWADENFPSPASVMILPSSHLIVQIFLVGFQYSDLDFDSPSYLQSSSYSLNPAVSSYRGDCLTSVMTSGTSYLCAVGFSAVYAERRKVVSLLRVTLLRCPHLVSPMLRKILHQENRYDTTDWFVAIYRIQWASFRKHLLQSFGQVLAHCMGGKESQSIAILRRCRDTASARCQVQRNIPRSILFLRRFRANDSHTAMISIRAGMRFLTHSKINGYALYLNFKWTHYNEKGKEKEKRLREISLNIFTEAFFMLSFFKWTSDILHGQKFHKERKNLLEINRALVHKAVNSIIYITMFFQWRLISP